MLGARVRVVQQSDVDCFSFFLSPCCSSVSSFQESLLRVLLGSEMLQVCFCSSVFFSLQNRITFLQRPPTAKQTHKAHSRYLVLQTLIINTLLEKLPEYMLDRSVFLEFA